MSVMGLSFWEESLQGPEMKILKRRTLEEVSEAALGNDWQRVIAHPIIQSIVGDHLSLTRPLPSWTAPMMVAALSKLKQRASHNDVTLLHKVMVYLCCSVMWRCTGASPLTDPEYNALQRVIYGGSSLDKIGNFYLGLHVQQMILWNHKKITDRYRKPGTMPLPELSKPKKKLQRLAKHRKRV